MYMVSHLSHPAHMCDTVGVVVYSVGSAEAAGRRKIVPMGSGNAQRVTARDR
jgi:hypothetical protein